MADCALQYGSDWIVPMHPDENAILERLETTKRYGLVSDYLVSWTGRAGRLKAKVTVWRNNGASGYVVQQYIARLLSGLVPGGRISVAD